MEHLTSDEKVLQARLSEPNLTPRKFARYLFSSGFKLFKFQDPRWRGKFIKDLINCNAFRQLPDNAALTADMVGLVGESNSHFRSKLSVREQVHTAVHLAEDWCVKSDLLKLNDMPVQLDGYRAYVARNFPVGAEEDVDENTPDNEDDREEFDFEGGGEWTLKYNLDYSRLQGSLVQLWRQSNHTGTIHRQH